MDCTNKIKKAILVLGMHRSGTSAITACLRALGAELGEFDNYPDAYNEKGYFENWDIVFLNEKLLEHMQISWNNPYYFNSIDLCCQEFQQFHEEAVRILQNNFNKSDIFCIKDPRICRLLPFWQKAISNAFNCELYYIHVFRNPLEVIRSLQNRSSMQEKFYCGNASQNLILWFSHYYQSFNFVDSGNNLFVHYDKMLSDAENEINRIANFLKTENKNTEVDRYRFNFLDNSLKHHSESAVISDNSIDNLDFIINFYLAAVELCVLSRVSVSRIKSLLSNLPDLTLFFACSNTSCMMYYENEYIKKNIDILNEQVTDLVGAVNNVNCLINLKNICIDYKNSQLYSQEKYIERINNNIHDLDSKIIDLENINKNQTSNYIDLQECVLRTNSELSLLNSKYYSLANSPALRIISRINKIICSLPFGARLLDIGNSALRRWSFNKQAVVIESSGLFDKNYYINQYPSVKDASDGPLLHFLSTGSSLGYNPHPLFDLSWYNEKYCPSIPGGVGVVYHYLQEGSKIISDPHPLFDSQWYVKNCADDYDKQFPPLINYLKTPVKNRISPHPLFDLEWYRKEATLSSENVDCIIHFLLSKDYQFSPCFLFDSIWYMDNYPDVSTNHMHPFLHYLYYGAKIGYSPHPLFDTDFYLSECNYDDEAKLNPLYHFIYKGEEMGISPYPLFHNKWYKYKYMNNDSKINFLFHYISSGVFNNNQISPAFDLTEYYNKIKCVNGACKVRELVKMLNLNGNRCAPIVSGEWKVEEFSVNLPLLNAMRTC